MKTEFRDGEVITIKKDLTLEQCVEYLSEVFGGGYSDHYIDYYDDYLVRKQNLGKKFTVLSSQYLSRPTSKYKAYNISWDLGNMIAPKLFEEFSETSEIKVFDDEE